jgi:hypothetical protein
VIILIISIIIIGASAVFTFRNNKDLRFFIFVSSLSITLICTFNHYYLKNNKNIDILMSSKNIFIDSLNQNNIPDKERSQMIQKINEAIDIMEYIVPFAYFLDALIFSLLGFYLFQYFFNKQSKISGSDSASKNEGNEEINIKGIERFKVYEYLVFVFIAGWFVVLLVDRSNNNYLYLFGLNIALILSGFYLIQAFGIIKFILRKKGMPSSILPAIILLFLLFGIEYFIFILIILSSIGAIDFWADFRKLELNIKKS